MKFEFITYYDNHIGAYRIGIEYIDDMLNKVITYKILNISRILKLGYEQCVGLFLKYGFQRDDILNGFYFNVDPSVYIHNLIMEKLKTIEAEVILDRIVE